MAIDKAYSSGKEYYAPLVLLVTPDTGSPLEVKGSLVVLTDPFKILEFLENWNAAGSDTTHVAAEVIETDERFDRIVSAALSEGKQVLADPIFDSDGTIVSGFELRLNR